MLEGIPTFAKIDIPREIIEDYDGNLFKMEFPLNMVINSNQNSSTDIEIYMSMDCKDPCEANHQKKMIKKEFSKSQNLKIQYGENSKDFISKQKFSNSVFLNLNSIKGANCKI